MSMPDIRDRVVIRTDGPNENDWIVEAPSPYDPDATTRYFGPDALMACADAARLLRDMLPASPGWGDHWDGDAPDGGGA